MDNLGPYTTTRSTVSDSRFGLHTGNAVHYRSTRNGAIVLADGVQFELLSTSGQGLQRSYRKLEHLYTIR